MNKIFRGFEFIRAYINGILIITKGDWSDHLNKLEQSLKNIKDNGLKCNIEKSLFGRRPEYYKSFDVQR